MTHPARTLTITDKGIGALQTHMLKQTETQVLWCLAATLSADGDVVSNADMSRTLDIAPTHISTAIKNLLKIKFIKRGDKIGTSYHYQLNPVFFQITE